MSRRILSSIILTIVILWSGATATALPAGRTPRQYTTWYVSVWGDDANTCQSPRNPCYSVSGALDKAAAGDVIVIGSGVYTENLVLDQDISLIGTDAASTRIASSTLGERVVVVASGASTYISRLAITGGFTPIDGAGVYVSGTLHLDHSLVTGNRTSGSYAGGIYNQGTLKITYSTIRENNARYYGGGLTNFGTAYISNSAIISNTCGRYGGGVYNYNAHDMTMVNVTVSGNGENNEAGGGLVNKGHLSVTNSTIAYNMAISTTQAGGLINQDPGHIDIKNTIVANNANFNCGLPGGPPDSYGYNIDSGDSCGLDHPNDQVNTDPELQPLGDNGGPTPCHPVALGPAVDYGSNAGCPVVDQRGAPRPVDGDDNGSSICDVGSYEYASTVPAPPRPDLLVEEFNPGGSTLPLGVPFGDQVSLYISNWGQVISDSYAIGLYLSRDTEIDPADLPLKSGIIDGPPLGDGEVVEIPIPESLAISANWLPGPAYLGVVLDRGDFILEDDEANNALVLPVTVLPTEPYTWTVDTTADGVTDLVSLRYALTYAQEEDTILFSPQAFPSDTAGIISLTSPLPEVTQGQLTIDGSGASVVIDGSYLLDGSYGLVLASDYNQILGLEIRNAPSGLRIQGDGNLIGRQSEMDCGGHRIAGPPPTLYNHFHHNRFYGIEIQGSDNILVGNGLTDNQVGGLLIESGSNNLIGGERLYDGNLIGGNLDVGLHLQGGTNNDVWGNYIGTAHNGSVADPNGTGLVLDGSGQYNNVGGPLECQGNLVAGNSQWGLLVDGSPGNSISGNWIGPNEYLEPLGNAQGGIWIDGASGTSIGGLRSPDACDQHCNLISGNTGHGILISGAGANTTNIAGNFIGTNANGSSGMGNRDSGIRIEYGSHNIGSTLGPNYGNLIGGNDEAGIHLASSNVEQVYLYYNIIGLNLNKDNTLGNQVGVWLENGPSDCHLNTNTIAGNHSYGLYLQGGETHYNWIRNNHIGYESGGNSLGNGAAGIYIAAGAHSNQIISGTLGLGNTIEHNEGSGILISGPGNIVKDNDISQNLGAGLQVSGTAAAENQLARNEINTNGGSGIELLAGSADTIVQGRDIHDNGDRGINIAGASHHNSIQNVSLYQNGGAGLDIRGGSYANTVQDVQIHDNQGAGINIYEDSYQNDLLENEIHHNASVGVLVAGSGSLGNRLSQNNIYANNVFNLDNTNGGNKELDPPRLLDYEPQAGNCWDIHGQACPGCRVELFESLPGKYSTYLGATIADPSSGEFDFQQQCTSVGTYLDTTATDADNNTSEYAADFYGFADLEVTDIEVVQILQNLDNSIPLVAEKAGYVRVHVRQDTDMFLEGRARLQIEHENGSFHEIEPGFQPLCPLQLPIKQRPDRSELQDAFCFYLSPSWTEPGQVTLTAILEPAIPFPESSTGNNCKTVRVTFEQGAPLPLRVFMAEYQEGLAPYDFPDESYLAGDRLALGDVDGDGLNEIVVSHAAAQSVTVYLQKTPHSEFAVGNLSVDDIAAGDLDGDGRDEVVLLDRGAERIEIWSYVDSGGVEAWSQQLSDYNAGSVSDGHLALGNLEGDNRAEMVIARAGDGQVRLYRFQSFQASPPFDVVVLSGKNHIYALDLAIGDLDLDGTDELLIGEANHTYVYQLNGDALGEPVDIAPAGGIAQPDGSYVALAVGDVDGDTSQTGGSNYAEILRGDPADGYLDIWAKQSSGDWDWVARANAFRDGPAQIYNSGGSLAVGPVYGPVAPLQVVSASSSDESRCFFILQKIQAGEWRTITTPHSLLQYALLYLKRLYPIPSVDEEIATIRFALEDGQPSLGDGYARQDLSGWLSGGDPSGMALMAATTGGWTGQTHMHSRKAVLGLQFDADANPPDLAPGAKSGVTHEIGHSRRLQHSWLYPSGPYSGAIPGIPLEGSQPYPYPRATLSGPGPEADLYILALDNPISPTTAGRFNPPGFAMDMDMVGDLAYLADYQAGLVILDLSDENQPTLLSQLDVGDGTWAVDVSGDYAYLADIYSGMIIVDVSDPAQPQQRGGYMPYEPDTHDLKPPRAVDVQVRGDYAYLVDYPYHAWSVDFGGRLRVLDVSNPDAPLLLWSSGQLQDRSGGPSAYVHRSHALFVDERYAYVAAAKDGLLIFDLQDTANPQFPTEPLSQLEIGSATDVVVAGDRAYVSYSDGLRVIHLGADRTSPQLLDYENAGLCYGVEIGPDDHVYLACHENGLRIIDVSNPDPNHNDTVGTYKPGPSPSWAQTVHYFNDRLYLLSWDQEAYGFDTGGVLLIDGEVKGVKSGLINPYQKADFMSYTAPASTLWMSVFNYLQLWEEINASTQAANSAPAGQGFERQAQALFITGHVYPEGGCGSLGLVVSGLEGDLSTLPLTSSVHLLLQDTQGALLADYPLSFEEEHPSQISPTVSGVAYLAAAMPYVEDTSQVLLQLDGQTVASRTASAHPPQVTLTYPNGGETLGDEIELAWTASDADQDKLRFTLLYSPDNGASWRVLDSDWPAYSYTVDGTLLAGSTQARFRVIAMDGFHTTQDDSDGPSTIPTRPPEAFIAHPRNGACFELGQIILLEAQAEDPDGKPIPDSGFLWSSDLDGVLGTGPALLVDDLSAGLHTLRLNVTDADNETSEHSVRIWVGDHYRLHLPLLLKQTSLPAAP